MSGVLDEEGFAPADARNVTFRTLESCNCYCSPEASDVLKSGLPTALPPLRWIDTGDYHYLSAILMERVTEPFALLLLDHHTDRQPLAFEAPGMLSCGSWVQWAEEHIPLMRAAVTIGAGPAQDAAVPEDLPVYVSLDLDVLSDDVFTTDWDQGSMSYDEMLASITAHCRAHRVLCVDICGGITRSKGATDAALSGNATLRRNLERDLSRLLLESDENR